jgi:hypothetical protein
MGNPVFIFDFDCTLTYTHYYWFLNGMSQFMSNRHWAPVIKRFDIDPGKLFPGGKPAEEQKESLINLFFGGKERFELVRGFLKELKEAGFDLYISSRGNCRSIKLLTGLLDLNEFFEGVNAGGAEDPFYQGGKVSFISRLVREKKPSHVFYADDDGKEHYELEQELKGRVEYTYFGANIGLLKDHNGLTREMIDQIKQKLPGQEPKQSPAQEPKQSPAQEPKQSPAQEPKQSPAQEPKQSPAQEPRRQQGEESARPISLIPLGMEGIYVVQGCELAAQIRIDRDPSTGRGFMLGVNRDNVRILAKELEHYSRGELTFGSASDKSQEDKLVVRWEDGILVVTFGKERLSCRLRKWFPPRTPSYFRRQGEWSTSSLDVYANYHRVTVDQGLVILETMVMDGVLESERELVSYTKKEFRTYISDEELKEIKYELNTYFDRHPGENDTKDIKRVELRYGFEGGKEVLTLLGPFAWIVTRGDEGIPRMECERGLDPVWYQLR